MTTTRIRSGQTLNGCLRTLDHAAKDERRRQRQDLGGAVFKYFLGMAEYTYGLK
jgi:hypothetical protein